MKITILILLGLLFPSLCLAQIDRPCVVPYKSCYTQYTSCVVRVKSFTSNQALEDFLNSNGLYSLSFEIMRSTSTSTTINYYESCVTAIICNDNLGQCKQ